MKQLVNVSSMPWLPAIDSSWDVVRADHFLSVKKTVVGEKWPDYTLLSLTKAGVVIRDFTDRQGKLPETFDSYQEVQIGDLVMCLFDMDETPRTVGISSHRGMITGAYTTFQFDQTIVVPRYFEYLFISIDDRKAFKAAYSGLRKTIRPPVFLSLRFPLPPLETQQRIADYLDRETAEIDAAVADLDKYVELLEKRRTLRLIEETRIRSSARMTTIGRHAQVSLGKTLQSEQKSQNEQLVNYVRAGNIQPNGVFDGEAKQMWMTPDEQSAYSLLPGDVLVVEGGAGFGRSLTLNLGLQGWGFQNHVIRIRPQSGWIGKFIDYSIRAHKTDGLIDLLAVGATIPGFSADKARNLPIAFLTEREQSEVVQTLDKDMDEIDFLIAESTRLRDLLLKRRSVLITEVVTGRKQV